MNTFQITRRDAIVLDRTHTTRDIMSAAEGEHLLDMVVLELVCLNSKGQKVKTEFAVAFEVEPETYEIKATETTLARAVGVYLGLKKKLAASGLDSLYGRRDVERILALEA